MPRGERRTLRDVSRMCTPSATKTGPSSSKDAITYFGVNMGRHAGSVWFHILDALMASK
eukprot:COSAG01_NODE_3710_length_5770_cov_10.433962_13_plen_58_part_01